MSGAFSILKVCFCPNHRKTDFQNAICVPPLLKKNVNRRRWNTETCSKKCLKTTTNYKCNVTMNLPQIKMTACFTIKKTQSRSERLSYYQRIDLAKNYPNDYLSIIISSMDQSKLLVPRLANQRKATSDAWLLRTHLIGKIFN
jgi:hypothetical protein